MEDDEFPAWPAEEADGTVDEPEETSEPTTDDSKEDVSQADEEPTGSDTEDDDSSNDEDEPGNDAPEPWTLPVRAAPILALQGETVTEFPLSQHVNGLESTSLVMDDELMRIVEARYDADGVRRLNVRMALVKEHISGYSHTHLDLFQKLQGVWWGAIGFGLLAATSVAQGLLAIGSGAFVLAGVAGLLMAKLDLHRLSFSDHGGRHDFYLSGWRQEPYLIHNSTALLGPAFVEFLRTSTLDTEHIDAVIKALGAPAKPAPELQSTPAPPPVLSEPTPNVTHALPPPPSVNASEEAPITVSSGPPISAQTPPAQQPLLPSPVPIQHAPAPPSLPAAPLPPPPAPVQHAPAPPALPAAPLPAPLPPPLAPAPPRSNIDEDALWDDLT